MRSAPGFHSPDRVLLCPVPRARPEPGPGPWAGAPRPAPSGRSLTRRRRAGRRSRRSRRWTRRRRSCRRHGHRRAHRTRPVSLLRWHRAPLVGLVGQNAGGPGAGNTRRRDRDTQADLGGEAEAASLLAAVTSTSPGIRFSSSWAPVRRPQQPVCPACLARLSNRTGLRTRNRSTAPQGCVSAAFHRTFIGVGSTCPVLGFGPWVNGRGGATSVRVGTTCVTTMRASFCRRASARLSWPSAWATTSRRCCARTRT